MFFEAYVDQPPGVANVNFTARNWNLVQNAGTTGHRPGIVLDRTASVLTRSPAITHSVTLTQGESNFLNRVWSHVWCVRLLCRVMNLVLVFPHWCHLRCIYWPRGCIKASVNIHSAFERLSIFFVFFFCCADRS